MAETSYVYAGTVRSAAGGSGGIFRQTAGDRRWEALTNGLPDETQVHAITVHPANPEVVFIGTTKGAFRSADRGGRWERLLGHRCWMRSERLRTTQAHRELDHLKPIQDGKGFGLAPPSLRN